MVPWPVAEPVTAGPDDRPGSPLSARQAATWAWWCCTPSSSTPSSSSAYLVDRYSGCRSWATTSGSTASRRRKCPALGEGAEGLVVLQIADVVGDEGVAAMARQNVPEPAPRARTWRGNGQGQPERLGGEPPGAAQRQLPPRNARTTESSARTWIRRSWTRNQSAIRQGARPPRRPGRRSARRRRSRWSARSASPPRPAAGGAGVHAASPPATGSLAPPTVPPPRPPPAPAQQDDRAAGAGQHGLLGQVDQAQRPGPGLGQPTSPRTACPRGACGPAVRPRRARWPRRRQVVAAEALDGHHGAVPEAGRRPGQQVAVAAGRRPWRSSWRQRRPAGRAAHRLGVEAPVARVVTLAGAVGAHGEGGHGGRRPVVGDVADDGEPGAQLVRLTSWTSGGTGRPGRPARPGSRRRWQWSRASAWRSRRPGWARPRTRCSRWGAGGVAVAPLDHRQPRRRLDGQRLQEPLDRLGGPLDLHEHPAGVVAVWPASPSRPAGACTNGRKPTPCTIPST